MAKEIIFQIAGTGGTAGRTSLDEVLRRLADIAKMTPTEVAVHMGTQAGSQMAHLEFERADPNGLLQNWEDVGHAAPRELSEEEYDTFLRGQHPTLDAIPVYGGQLKN